MAFFASSLRSIIGITTVAAVLAQTALVSAIEPEPVLKFVYFVPSNIAFDPSAYAAMQTTVADYAAWNRRYFNGNAPNYKVDYVLGDHTWEWYVYSREEFNRVTEGNLLEHRYDIAAELTHREIIRKFSADPRTDKNLKHIIFMHEHAAVEDTNECASEGEGMAWMSYDQILRVATERTYPPLLLAHEIGHVWGLNHDGPYGDCMQFGFDNANKTCNYFPDNQAKVVAKCSNFYTGYYGRNLSTREAPPSCTAKMGDDCTGTNGVRSCCPPEGYCQPISSTKYQCMKPPITCGDQLTDTDYTGNDLAQHNATTLADCCSLCSHTYDCRAYTYVLAGAPGINPGSCYLKTLAGEPKKSIGAVSGVILDDWSTAPCATKIRDSCKNSVNKIGCCPTGSYCMPWSLKNYRCAVIPARCSVQRMDTKYIGEDIRFLVTSSPDVCCDVCAQTQGCKAYTYYSKAVSGKPSGGATSRETTGSQSRN